MDDWEVFAERLTLIILVALSKMCYRVAEWFGTMGLNFEFRYRQLVSS